MITYKLFFIAFDCILNKGKMKNVITNVHWKYIGENEDGIISSLYGSRNLELPNAKNFIDYNKLTEEQIISWIEPLLDIEEMKNIISEQINLKINPEKVTLKPSL